jgi:hypothetical protein
MCCGAKELIPVIGMCGMLPTVNSWNPTMEFRSWESSRVMYNMKVEGSKSGVTGFRFRTNF